MQCNMGVGGDKSVLLGFYSEILDEMVEVVIALASKVISVHCQTSMPSYDTLAWSY